MTDYLGEEIRGSFYLPEIQRVDKPEQYEVEKIVSRKRQGGRMMYLVKWLGYPKHMNSWVTQEDLVRL